MNPDNKLAQWAALFISAQAEAGPDAQPTAPAFRYPGVTQAASELLQAVDAGGVPAFVTGNLRQIAEDNGIEVSGQCTPNEIVDAIRRKSQEAGVPAPG